VHLTYVVRQQPRGGVVGPRTLGWDSCDLRRDFDYPLCFDGPPKGLVGFVVGVDD
jgi:hypothetical protein